MLALRASSEAPRLFWMSREDSLWGDEQDERELLRVDVVGLAAEVATLAAHIREALGDAPEPEAVTLAATCHSLSDRAHSVLAPQTQFDGISTDALRAALGILRDDQRRMRELRQEVEDLVDSSRVWLP
jgi:hypothetical protein